MSCTVGRLLPLVRQHLCRRPLVACCGTAAACVSRIVPQSALSPSRRLLTCRALRLHQIDVVGVCQRRQFRTSARRDVHPVLWLILKPFTKIWVILWGRYFRKWWKTAPLAERNHVKRLFRDSWHILASLLLIAASLFGVYYATHLQVCPMTGRRRFVVLTSQQMQMIAAAGSDELKQAYESKVVPTDHPTYEIVRAVVERIVLANSDLDVIRNTPWHVTLISDETTHNAMVLPSGDIFVFTGLFKLVKNVDQLSIILAHELSHVLLGHSAEHLSFAQLLDFATIAVMAALWIFIPNEGIALVTQWFYSKVLKIGADLPYSRFLEQEADEVGLVLAAKACFDVRQGPVFWNAMDAATKKGDEAQTPTLLSTHPAHDSRTENLHRKLPEAIMLRELCSCPPLPPHSVSAMQRPEAPASQQHPQ